jgi:hypothetical protein
VKFTYNIQKIDFFPDQFEEKGPVNLEGAIEAFQTFPFTDQLKQIEERELTSCFPSIAFVSDEGKTLGVWAQDGKGFFLHYDNGIRESEFFLSYEFETNSEGLEVEEFIEKFFNGTIEESLFLKDLQEEDTIQKLKLKHTAQIITYSFASTKKLKLLLWTLPFLLLALFLVCIDIEKKIGFGWGLHLAYSIFWLPASFIFLTYWFKNNNAQVIIDTKEKTLEYVKGGLRTKFHREEIFKCELNVARSWYEPWKSYRYIWIILKDHRQIVITNFITEPEKIIDLLKLHYKTDKRTIPFLPI